MIFICKYIEMSLKVESHLLQTVVETDVVHCRKIRFMSLNKWLFIRWLQSHSDNIAGGIAGEMLKLNKNVGDYFVF